MADINWHQIFTVIAAIVTTTIAIGGVMYTLMRGFFKTTAGCLATQTICQQGVCKKIDELKDDIKEDRELANQHYAEIKSELGIIKGRLVGR